MGGRTRGTDEGLEEGTAGAPARRQTAVKPLVHPRSSQPRGRTEERMRVDKGRTDRGQVVPAGSSYLKARRVWVMPRVQGFISFLSWAVAWRECNVRGLEGVYDVLWSDVLCAVKEEEGLAR